MSEIFPCWRCDSLAITEPDDIFPEDINVRCGNPQCAGAMQDFCVEGWNANARRTHELRQRIVELERKLENRNLI